MMKLMNEKDKTAEISDRVQRAMDMAERFHEGQKRRGRDGFVPYYDEHILGVYSILKDECHIVDEDVLVTALLHDTVEDTDCTLVNKKACKDGLVEAKRLLEKLK